MKKNLVSQFMIDLTSQVLSRSITKGLELAKNKKNQPRKPIFVTNEKGKNIEMKDFDQKRHDDLSFKLGIDSNGQDIVYSFKDHGHLKTFSNLYFTDNEYNQREIMHNLFIMNMHKTLKKITPHKIILIENINSYNQLINNDKLSSKYYLPLTANVISHIRKDELLNSKIKDIKETIKYRKMLCQYYNVKNVDQLIHKYNKTCEDIILIIDDYTDEFFKELERNHLNIDTFLKDAYDTNIFVVINHYVKQKIEFSDKLNDQIQSSIYFKDNNNSMREELKSEGEFIFINDDLKINKKGLIDKY